MLLSILFILGSFMVFEAKLRPGISAVVEVKARQMAITVMNQAVLEAVANEIDYQDLVVIHKDNQGRVVLMQPNTIKINQLVAATSLTIQKALQELSRETFYFPLGAAMNSPLLSSFGPTINYRVQPMGNVDIVVQDRFDSAGINQTRHSISLQIECQMLVLVPVLRNSINVVTTMPLTETILVGEVPNAYMQLNLGP
jgi:sporulation protein YunB